MAAPTCLYCGRRLRRYIIGTDRWGYNGSNLFCSLRCGFAWAERKLQQP